MVPFCFPSIPLNSSHLRALVIIYMLTTLPPKCSSSDSRTAIIHVEDCTHEIKSLMTNNNRLNLKPGKTDAIAVVTSVNVGQSQIQLSDAVKNRGVIPLILRQHILRSAEYAISSLEISEQSDTFFLLMLRICLSYALCSQDSIIAIVYSVTSPRSS